MRIPTQQQETTEHMNKPNNKNKNKKSNANSTKTNTNKMKKTNTNNKKKHKMIQQIIRRTIRIQLIQQQ